MKKTLLLTSAVMLLGAVPSSGQGTLPLVPARISGFAADLAQQPNLGDQTAWHVISDDNAWRKLAGATQAERQQARWDYARSLIGQERGAEALGVLEVMGQDDPDLFMVDAYRLARGAALVQLRRFTDALADLAAAGLVDNAEACAWRMRALSFSRFAGKALNQMHCAAPAFARPRHRIFALAAANAAVEGGQPALALRWLNRLPDRDPAANLYRGRAEFALGHSDQARLRFARVERSGSMAQRMEARLGQIEAEITQGKLKGDAALNQLAALCFAWRGDMIEERALRLQYRLSAEKGDLLHALAAGATLFRFFDPGRQGAGFLPELQAQLASALDPARKLPLEQAAGLYWDYRDLSPSGADGDLLVSRLAERLQAASIYGRAADLLEHQLFYRAGDLARGALSVKVAGLHILAGRADRALDMLRRSADPAYPDAMAHGRKRLEAVALAQIGRTNEALAILQDVPGAEALRAEILWKRRDWRSLVAETAVALPAARSLSEIDQTVVLRHAIALAMMGGEGALSALRARYIAQFQGLKTGPVFDMLTDKPGSVDPETLARAMAAMPGASPAGDIAALLEQAPVKPTG